MKSSILVALLTFPLVSSSFLGRENPEGLILFQEETFYRLLFCFPFLDDLPSPVWSQQELCEALSFSSNEKRCKRKVLPSSRNAQNSPILQQLLFTLTIKARMTCEALCSLPPASLSSSSQNYPFPTT